MEKIKELGIQFAKWMNSVEPSELCDVTGFFGEEDLDSFGAGIAEGVKQPLGTARVQMIYVLANYVADMSQLTLEQGGERLPRQKRRQKGNA